jgi:hemoglobin/transferrin/lactoferrin receptor protein
VQRLLLSLAAASLAVSVHAQTTLKEVKVKGQREKRTDVQRSAPTTTINRERIERWQPSTIFEAVEGTPGVSIEGGPRSSGMAFNIRGYSDSEDVLVKLDGAQKNFEKYRFGGTFIEPEMLKTISITRGPDLLSGAGALGGTVNATTRDASDMLKPGQRYGGRIKFGTGSVNDEINRHGSVFARPIDSVDLLAAITTKNSRDYTLPDGTTLKDSAIDQHSTLFKGTLFPSPALSLSLMAAQNKQQGLEAFDATGGQPGLFGSVLRYVDDSTYTLNGRYESPDNRWIDLSAVVGRSLTSVQDQSKPGQSFIANPVTGVVNDYYDYDVTTVDLKNTSRHRIGSVANDLTLAFQGISNKRQALRITGNPLINNAVYPGGYNPAQPSGERESFGLVAVDTVSWGAFSIAPGIRWDHYTVGVEGPTRTDLEQLGEPASTTYTATTASAALTWRPGMHPWLFRYSYVEGFRPPLLDEAFTRGAFSRCIFLPPTSRPASGVCGSLYTPERSTTQEISVSYAPLTPRPGLSIEGRLAVFVDDRRNTLMSIREVAPGVVGQPGWEHRQGVEADASFATRRFFGNVAYTAINGEIYDGSNLGMLPLYTVPGDTFSLTLGARAFEGKLDFGFRYRDVTGRMASVNLLAGNRPVLGYQPGYELLDLFLGYRPFKGTEIRLALDNALNETYYLNGFAGGIGLQAPGRNFRVSVAVEL